MTLGTRLSTALEAGANLGILVVALLLGWTIVQRQCHPSGRPTSPQSPVPGTSLAIADVDWSQADHTLVMALSTGCHFCSESGDFYRRLSGLVATRPRTRLIAVLPDPVEDSQRYLDQMGVKVTAVRSVPLSRLRVSGTPTLILADKSGVVSRVWVGKLSTTQEQEVIDRLVDARTGRLAPSGLREPRPAL